MEALTYYARERDRHLNQAQDITDLASGRAMTTAECDRVKEHTETASAFQDRIDAARESAELRSNIERLGQQMASEPDLGTGDGNGLYAAMRAAGYDRKMQPRATVPFEFFRRQGMEATATFDGPSYAPAVPRFTQSPGLGADRRFLYPSLRSEPVAPDETSVSTFRQKARTLPTLGDMVRDLAATSAKPETATQAELLNVPLHQIATVESEVPNIMLESAALRGWIDEDLRLAFASGVDAHVLAQIEAASPATGGAGGDLLESILLAAAAVADAGYSPSLFVANPDIQIDLTLATQPGTGDYIFSGNPMPLQGLQRVAVAGAMVAYVIDPGAAGTFYSSPVTIATFEENAGKTNTSTVRIESNGVFIVQRVGAIAEVVITS
jgi:hypothetical protein